MLDDGLTINISNAKSTTGDDINADAGFFQRPSHL
jgi:hypothetical protein